MLRSLKRLGDLASLREAEHADPGHHPGFAPLRALTAQMLLVTGAEATLGSLAATRRAGTGLPRARPVDYPEIADRTPARSYAATWAPALLAPLAATAHLAHLTRPSESANLASRVLDAAVVGVGVLGLAQALRDRGRGAGPSVAPLALASAGLLGLLVDRQERAARAERDRLARRASVVERLVPRRRARLDRVVVHV
jgi:hypothetical protein